MLTSAELSAMQATAELALPGTAVIQSRSYSHDGGGGGTATFTASGTVSCRVDPIGGAEDATGERISPDATWVVTLPAETTVTRDSRIVAAGVTYEVEALRAPRSWELTLRAECSELT